MVKTGILRFLSLMIVAASMAGAQATEAAAQARQPGRANPSARAKARAKSDTEDLAVVRGKVVYKDNAPFKIKFEDIDVKLRPQVILPPAPVPDGFAERTPEDRRKWLEAFEKTEAGKKLIAKRKALIEEAEVFDVLVERDGSFVVYDVPPGVYGIQGRLDRDFKDTTYAFEVFGEILVKENVDEIPLAPIMLEVTPLLEVGKPAPAISVDTYNSKSKLNLGTFKDKYIFVNFWSTESNDLRLQRQVQEMYVKLKGKYPIKLLSICLDEKRKAAVKFIVENKLKEGSHGFTDGWDHPTLDNYGIRSIPSFWLIGPKGSIRMTQYNFSQAFAAGSPDLGQVVSDRIEGKDVPTPAK